MPGSDGAALPEQEARLQQQMQSQLDAEQNGMRSARAALENAVAQLQQIRQQFLAEAEGQLLTLSLEIARKVLMQEIQAERYQIDPIVQEARRRVPASADVTVLLHPDDLSRCRLAQDQQDPDAPRSVRLQADPSIRRAECLLQTVGGPVQSAVDEHLAEIADAFNTPE